MKKALLAAFVAATGVVLLLGACGRRAAGPTPRPFVTEEARRAVSGINARFLSSRIAEFSSDAMEGRRTATPGDAKARAWLVAQLQEIGLEPGGPGGWEQPFDVVGITSKLPPQWTFENRAKQKLSFKWLEEYVGNGGSQSAHAQIRNAELVFVGYGIQAPEFQWDDIKGVDLKGKVLVMLNNDPDWDPALFGGTTRLYYGRWTYKYEQAARLGAVAAIIIHTEPSAGYPFQVVQSGWSGESFEVPAGGEPRLQFRGWLTEGAARALVGFGGHELDDLVAAARSRDFRPVPLGVRTSLAFDNELHQATTANVAGLLRGSDPQLSKEVVVYTAHHDHLGIGEPDAKGDRIYNGAVDNGTGVAEVLGIAKAFKSLPSPPRRSVLFLFVGAEEQGTLGSRYYAAHPTFPPGRIAANINIDEGNIWGKATDVVFIGKGKSTLDAIVERYAQYQGRIVKPDQFADRGYFYRSDQISFAQLGVPAFYQHFSTDYRNRPPGWGKQQVEAWEEHQYHQPSDQIEPTWNYDGMLEDLQLSFYVGLDVANADRMPEWKPGDEFEAARRRAISDSAGSPANTGR